MVICLERYYVTGAVDAARTYRPINKKRSDITMNRHCSKHVLDRFMSSFKEWVWYNHIRNGFSFLELFFCYIDIRQVVSASYIIQQSEKEGLLVHACHISMKFEICCFINGWCFVWVLFRIRSVEGLLDLLQLIAWFISLDLISLIIVDLFFEENFLQSLP